MKQIIELSDGLIEFTELWKSKLILGRVKTGFATKTEIRSALVKAGYTYGIIEKSVDILADNFPGQVPLALAYIDDEAGKLWFHFEKPISDKDIISWLKKGKFDSINMMYPVKAGDRMLTLATPPHTILRFPKGDKDVIKALGEESVGLYTGYNTILNEQRTSVIAENDGFAHRSIYGVVSIYPLKTVSSIGTMHGEIKYESALEVERDVLRGSKIMIPSNLMVRGVVKSAYVRADGSIICSYGMDNKDPVEYAKIIAGQSVNTAMISHYNAWIGHMLLVSNKILNSKIECLNTVVAPQIHGSEIRVGNKLFTNEIAYNSQIFLGPDYVHDPDLAKRKNFHIQHRKRLSDLESEINTHKIELEREKAKSLSQLNKLNRLSRNLISSDLSLARFNQNMQERINKYDQKVEQYRKTLALYSEEKMQLSFSESQLKNESNPEIWVFGKINSGTVVTAPNQVIRVREPLESIVIKLNQLNGTLSVEKMDSN